MKKLSLFLFIFFSLFSFAQESPPPVAMPKENQEKLIDELINVSNYKEALMNYARVYFWGEQYKNGKRNYGNKEIDEVLKKFDFEKFKKNSIYNSLSFVSEQKLKNLIEFYKKNGGLIDDKNNLILITASISHNLQYQLNSEMEKLLKEKTSNAQ
ncbi:hypothetical protein SAMN05421847_1542 [Halpernia humi]|uniref:Uncharacterized protein n=1 Tax=Halpernia humi TaxID=493375 RepID=A0A1H5XT07_9FLAO|nr:hypothetical protein [Halpernia humi]SEG14851.1 hypothetical protein SAMN05421847_1542 [Halpernia humi]